MTLKECRIKLNLKQTELAKLAEVTPVQICRVENGVHFPLFKTRFRVQRIIRLKNPDLEVNWVETYINKGKIKNKIIRRIKK